MFIETPYKQNLQLPITQAVTPLGQVTRDPASNKYISFKFVCLFGIKSLPQMLLDQEL